MVKIRKDGKDDMRFKDASIHSGVDITPPESYIAILSGVFILGGWFIFDLFGINLNPLYLLFIFSDELSILNLFISTILFLIFLYGFYFGILNDDHHILNEEKDMNGFYKFLLKAFVGIILLAFFISL